MGKQKPKQTPESETQTSKPVSSTNSIWKVATYTLIISFATIGALIIGTVALLWNKVYPAVQIANTDISLLTTDQAEQRVASQVNQRLNKTFTFYSANQTFQLTLNSKHINTNLPQTVDKAYQLGRQQIHFTPTKLDLEIRFTNEFDQLLQQIAHQIDQPAIDAQLKIEDQIITVTPSQVGKIVDQQLLKDWLITYLNGQPLPSTELPIKTAYPKLNYDTALKIKATLDQVKQQPLEIKYEELTWSLDLETLVSLLDLTSSKSKLAQFNISNTPIIITSIDTPNNTLSNSQIVLDSEKAKAYFATLAQSIDRGVQEPLFQFDGTRVTQFRPPLEGRSTNISANIEALNQIISSGNIKPLVLTVETTSPTNKLSNDLGIKELIASGVSNFAHSIPNRIFNVELAASRVNGVLIPPGEDFSFVKTIGDISAASGYKQAYVIKSGRTVLDDGGGVCQVSTTVFRAALNSGLPIIERTAHAYRVEYYEQGFAPGLDATIFSPSVDFKFRNDTAGHILIQSRVEGTTLYIDFYGTKDNRVVEVSKPVITSQTPPLPEIRQDDPSLPRGVVKQVDWPAWGANVIFSRKVTKEGQVVIDESFRSNYKPWQAVYLVGTKDI